MTSGRVLVAALASDETTDQLLRRHVEMGGHLDGGAHRPGDRVRRFGLLDGARKAVENVPTVFTGRLHRLIQHVHDELVGNKVAARDIRLRGTPQLGVVGYVIAEQVAAGDVRDAEVLGQPHCLRALAGTRRTDQEQTHWRRLAVNFERPECVVGSTRRWIPRWTDHLARQHHGGGVGCDVCTLLRQDSRTFGIVDPNLFRKRDVVCLNCAGEADPLSGQHLLRGFRSDG